MNLILSILRSAVPAGVLVLASTFAHAQLTVEVSGAGSNRMPVAVATFEGESALPRAITDVVRADLERSGLFKLVELGPAPMGADNPDLARARSRGADSLAVGTIAPAGGGRYQVTVRLLDPPDEQFALGVVEADSGDLVDQSLKKRELLGGNPYFFHQNSSIFLSPPVFLRRMVSA